ncbi:MAG: hypothetical protein IJ266_03330, partial [Elusimicrobiaceae bacterium]|nr:hypothetical protein [Elusimicrobiaceae bacterium]
GWTAYILTGGYGSTDTFAGNEENENTESQTPTCDEDEKPKDKRADNGATGTSTCVNGQWKYQWTGGRGHNSDYSHAVTVCGGSSGVNEYACAGAEYKGKYNVCSSRVEGVCMGSTFSGEYSTCEGVGSNGCVDSNFSGSQSRCLGSLANACGNSTFTGDASYCWGFATNACTGSTFSGTKSYCKGNTANGCAGTTILGGAYCTATVAGGCDGVTYQENSNGVTGCCQGDYCPVGAPKCGNWNDTTQAYDIDGTW